MQPTPTASPTHPASQNGPALPGPAASLTVLLVEDDDVDAEEVIRLLSRAMPRVTVHRVTRLADACTWLMSEPVNAILLDLGLPDARGLGALDAAKACVPEVPIIVLTGQQDDRVGLEAVQRGAQDYLEKHRLEGWLLARVLRYAVERQRIEDRLRRKQSRMQQYLDLAGVLFVGLDAD
ncbi:MAG: response regulator, partial [Bacteroidetes bacterium]|nr:response regulator [Bacteroidota bacterium]